MNFIKAPQQLLKGKDMHFLIFPLRIISGLSSVVFVLSFCYEIFIYYNPQSHQKWALSALIFTLSVWAFLEIRPAVKNLHLAIVKNLQYLLLLQCIIPIIRPLIGILIDINITEEWMIFFRFDIGGLWFLLLVYSSLFILIMDFIIRLFSFNEKSKALILESQMLSSLNALAMARDNETGNHIIRTQIYVKILGLRLREMGHYSKELDNLKIDLLVKAAPLHDVGKVGIPDNILHKPGPLNDEEWLIMKTHTTIGEAVLSSSELEFEGDNGVVKMALKIAGGHHEKWDGTGYPRGLKGEDIPLPARIMAIADVYDALVSDRVYKAGWSHEEAIKEIVSKRGSHFDPLLVDAFILENDHFKTIANKYRDSW